MAPASPLPATHRIQMKSSLVHTELPIIKATEPFADVVDKVSKYIVHAIDSAYTYEQLRTSPPGQGFKSLISALAADCHHPAIVAALL